MKVIRRPLVFLSAATKSSRACSAVDDVVGVEAGADSQSSLDKQALTPSNAPTSQAAMATPRVYDIDAYHSCCEVASAALRVSGAAANESRGVYACRRSSRLGYLTEPMFGYGLARYAWLRDERDPQWARYLDTNPRTFVKRGLRYLSAERL